MENANRSQPPSSPSVQISDDVSVDTRDVGVGGQMRRCRDRQATGFVAGDALSQPTDDKSVQFSSVVKVDDRPVAASSQMKRVRERVSTGFLSKAAEAEVNFSDVVSIEERQVESSGKTMRSCRDRQATGFVTEDVMTPSASETPLAAERTVLFERHVSIDDREVENPEVPMRSCRDRQATGFVTDDAFATTPASTAGDRTVQFQSAVSVDETEVANSSVPLRSCRDRKATGFVTGNALAEHGGVSFHAEVDGGSADKTVQFSNVVNVEERDADNQSAPMRSCRDRQSTGFATPDVFEGKGMPSMQIQALAGRRSCNSKHM
jgi:hypothetical protein